jgi:hypothetical protein
MLSNSKEQVDDIFLKLNSAFSDLFGKPSGIQKSNSGDVRDYTTDMDRINLPCTAEIVSPVNHTSVCPWPSGCGCIGTPYIESE